MALVPWGVVTVTSTGPKAAAAGDVAVILLLVTTVKLVAALEPNRTAVAPLKLEPAISTKVPPASGPLAPDLAHGQCGVRGPAGDAEAVPGTPLGASVPAGGDDADGVGTGAVTLRFEQLAAESPSAAARTRMTYRCVFCMGISSMRALFIACRPP